MGTIDRITLIVLTLGLWALVLTPGSIEAHHAHAAHDCAISGIVGGQTDLDGKFSVNASMSFEKSASNIIEEHPYETRASNPKLWNWHLTSDLGSTTSEAE